MYWFRCRHFIAFVVFKFSRYKTFSCILICWKIDSPFYSFVFHSFYRFSSRCCKCNSSVLTISLLRIFSHNIIVSCFKCELPYNCVFYRKDIPYICCIHHSLTFWLLCLHRNFQNIFYLIQYLTLFQSSLALAPACIKCCSVSRLNAYTL